MTQKTICSEVVYFGLGGQTGITIKMSIKPGKVNSGIIFIRSDISSHNCVSANYDNFATSKFNTTISNGSGVKVMSIEHLMAAFWHLGISNAIVEINNEEIPIYDGSAYGFIKLICDAGISEQCEPEKTVKVCSNARVFNGDSYIEAYASDGESLIIDYTISYPKISMIGTETMVFHSSSTDFLTEISKAKTFCTEEERGNRVRDGYAYGWNQENSLVYNEKSFLKGYRPTYKNEALRHKILDIIGDLFSSGYFIYGRFKCYKSGHFLNQKIVEKIISQQ